MSTDVAGGEESLHERLVSFLERYHEDDIAEFAQRFPSEQSSLVIDYGALVAFDHDITHDVRTSPERMREMFEDALCDVTLPAAVDLSEAAIRFGGVNTDGVAYDVGSYSKRDVGEIIGIRGQVSKTTQKRMRLVEGAFECQRCGTITRVMQESDSVQEPHECHGCERQGPFTVNFGESEYVDDQLIRLQLPPEKSNGQTDERVDIVLEDDLVKTVSPGDRVRVDARLDVTQTSNDKPIFDFVAEAEDIAIQETDFEDIDISDDDIEAIEAIAADDPFTAIVDSIAPSLKGLETEKLAIGLQLFGGTRKTYPDGSIERGDSHVLFVGDPGVGKSALLEYADSLAPRSVFTDGKGSTAAGLTASAVRDDFGDGSEWTIEGGSIVKAHKGLACIDELDDMDDDDRSALHTALEKQEVPVAKAGITANLPARTKLLAAANPMHGRFDPYEPVSDQIGMRPALLSRFDLIFTLKDKVEKDQDREIIEHKSDVAEVGQRSAAGRDVPDELLEDVEPVVDQELFRKWVAHATQVVTPVLSEAAKELLNDEFEALRRSNVKADEDPDDNPIPVTLRKQEAILRIAESSARARLSEDIDASDVERALRLVKRSMRDVGTDPETDKFDADVVESGRSRTMHERMKTLNSVVDELDKEHERGAPLSKIVERMEAEGHDQETVMETISSLRKKGDLYEPENDGHYKTS